MRIAFCVVGKIKAGPEFNLLKKYLDRINRIGRNFHIGPVEVVEVDSKVCKGSTDELKRLESIIPVDSYRILLDERGKQVDSIIFSGRIVALRDSGIKNVSFIIGGSNGVSEEFRKNNNEVMSFSKMVWPHLLFRVMLAEQLYRCVTIVSGAPYHKK